LKLKNLKNEIDILKQIFKNFNSENSKKITFLLKDNVLEWVLGDETFISNLNKNTEKEWGNNIINKNTNQWTTFLGEHILEELLYFNNENPKRTKINNFCPDFECDNYIYENKCRSWHITGTAGEKILGTPLKYYSIYEHVKKPIKIVCMAYQEYEAVHKFHLFNNDIAHKKLKDTLNYFDTQLNITFIKFSELLLKIIPNNENIKTEIETPPTLEPFLKWAGGKRQIIKTISNYFPHNINNYYEPFIGSGSVISFLMNSERFFIKKIHLSDLLEPLINLYTLIKNNPHELFNEFSKKNYVNSLDNFTINKNTFNEIKFKNNENLCKLSCLFLYLNKTGYNGLYRENQKGIYNIPYGKYKNPLFFKKENILSWSSFLNKNNVYLTKNNYTYLQNLIFQENDFIYFDPPYYDNFVNYTSNGFSKDDQINLKNLIDFLTSKNIKIALSNSSNDFIKNLYKDYNIIEIPVKRFINCKSDSRNNIINELLILNYKPNLLSPI
jgi:DNA adenine methylase